MSSYYWIVVKCTDQYIDTGLAKWTPGASAVSPDREVFVEAGASVAFSTADGSHNKLSCTF